MPFDKLRREIAHEAARLLYTREESEYLRAKLKAAKRLCSSPLRPKDLPSNLEVRELLLSRTLLFEGASQSETLRKMRLTALRLMRLLGLFRPRLIGSVLTGHVRRGSDVDIHLFSDQLDPITAVLDANAIPYTIERKRVRKMDQMRIYQHIHARDEYPVEFTVYAADQAHVSMISSLTHKKIERASAAELEQLLAAEHPEQPLDQPTLEAEARIDRFQMYELLLLPLEEVQQDPRYHPEGDALYHSLQVYQLARDAAPYDEEFLLAGTAARCRQGHRSGRSCRCGVGGAQRVYYRTHCLANRASYGNACPSQGNARSAGTTTTASQRKLRRPGAARPVRSPRTAAQDRGPVA
jgi:hypothetical protein